NNNRILEYKQPVAIPTVEAGLKFSPSSLNFGKATLVSSTSHAKPVTITNKSKHSKKVPGISIAVGAAVANNSAFAVSAQCATTPLPPGKSCKIEVTFTPPSTSAQTGMLMIPNDSDSGELRIPLEGAGKAPKVKK